MRFISFEWFLQYRYLFIIHRSNLKFLFIIFLILSSSRHFFVFLLFYFFFFILMLYFLWNKELDTFNELYHIWWFIFSLLLSNFKFLIEIERDLINLLLNNFIFTIFKYCYYQLSFFSILNYLKSFELNSNITLIFYYKLLNCLHSRIFRYKYLLFYSLSKAVIIPLFFLCLHTVSIESD